MSYTRLAAAAALSGVFYLATGDDGRKQAADTLGWSESDLRTATLTGALIGTALNYWLLGFVMK